MKKKFKILLLIVFIFLCIIPVFAFAKSIISGRVPAHSLVGPNPSNDFNFFLTATPRDHVISGSTSGSFTLKDILYDTITAGIVDHEADIGYSTLPAGSFAIFSTTTTSTGSVDQNGKITRVSDGNAIVNLKVTPTRGVPITKQKTYAVSRTSGAVTVSFNSYVAGSLGKYLYDDINTRLGSLTASDATTKLFSTQDQTTATYVWNTGFWAYGTDLTPIVAYNSYTDCCGSGDFERRAGVMISPRHMAYANHYTFPIGTTIRLIKQDGTVVTRTITNQAQVGSTDIEIALLDSDVPAGIGFAKVLPANYLTYLPSMTSTTTIPTLNLLGGAYSVSDTDKQGYVRELQISVGSTLFYTPTIAQRLAFYGRDYAVGDSGNPSFLIINNGLVLLDTTTSFGGYGPSYADNITAINSTMASLGGGYTLTTVDLSAFNTY